MVDRLLLDTNMLLLFLVGNLRADLVGKQRKLRAYDLADLGNLMAYVNAARRHVTLPNITTEVSNHIGSGQQVICSGAPEALAQYCADVAEEYVPSRNLVAHPRYFQLGLTDVAVFLASDPSVTILTADYKLFGVLQTAGANAVNIRHSKLLS